MKLLYIGKFMFTVYDGETYALPSCADAFFQKYLDVFDSVKVLGEEIKGFLDKSALVRMEDTRITVSILPGNTSPKDFKNDFKIKKALRQEILKADALLIKPASRKGIMAIRYAKKFHKPYMIEMTGDIHNALLQHPSLMRRFYAPVLYKKIKRAIRNCPFGLYVSENYLQSKYAIPGRMCGCSDVVLEKSDVGVLNRRIERIDGMQDGQRIDLALIGFYQSNLKGVDTAIRALALLPKNYHLNILGNGTEESRHKWFSFGETLGVTDRIHFPEPLPSSGAVLQWLDTMDMFVFPTRSEGFGRCVAEAMSRACPCVATDICTMPELLPQECLHPLNDERMLASLILGYSTDKEQMKWMARVNFENAKKYDIDLLRERRRAFLTEFREYCETYAPLNSGRENKHE